MRSHAYPQEPHWDDDAPEPPTIRPLRGSSRFRSYGDGPRSGLSTLLTLAALIGLALLSTGLDERAPAKSWSRLADMASHAMAVKPSQVVRVAASPGNLTFADATLRAPMLAAASQAPEPAATPQPEAPAPAAPAPAVAPEIAAAQQECGQLLAGITLDSEPLAPIQEANCAVAAPLRLRRVGASGLELRPPAVVNCRVAVAVHAWVETVLQPAAREHFGSPVKRIGGVRAYVCRNRNNAKAGPASEHATANAIDITELQLADGRIVSVARDWGAVAREAQAARVSASGVAGGLPTAQATKAVMGPPAPPQPTPAGRFLRKIHAGACPLFGTVLGPEANEAHRDHLHFDLKPRGRKPFCE